MAEKTSEPGKSKRRKLVVVGQTPPPFHGQAIAIQTMLDAMDPKDYIHVPMRFSERVYDNGRLQVRKFTHLIGLIFRALSVVIRHRGCVLYYPPAPASWVPIVRDIAFLSIVRPFVGKTVFHFHAYGVGQFTREHFMTRWLGWLWRRPDLGIVLGESGIDDAELFSPKRLEVVPFGIDMPTYDRPPRDSTKPLRVLYVGMHSETKGIFDILETAALLKDLNVEFRMVGTYKHKETQPRFEAHRSDLGLNELVQTVGQRTGDDLWKEYREADLFFFPTYFESETFGLVTIEAMIHSLPVVASAWRGPGDIVRDQETGFLCEPRNVQQYADSIRRLADDPDLMDRMSVAARECYSQNYRSSHYTGKLNELFKELCTS